MDDVLVQGDWLAGGVLAAGSVATLGCALVRPRVVLLGVLLAGALAAGAAASLLSSSHPRWSTALGLAAVACAAGGLAVLARRRFATLSRLSGLDGIMGASATAALLLALGARPQAVVAGGAVAGALGVSRWRPGWSTLLGMAGVACLGAGDGAAWAAAPLLVAVAARREPPCAPGPAFSRIVLAAVLGFAAVALGLLVAGQVARPGELSEVLSVVTVLAGMARSGLTVVERLRESQHQAQTDDLTGLGNRRHLLDRLEAAIAALRTGEGELALLLIDLDGFKELNDTLGHHAGDQVLRQLGPRLAGTLRADDTLARLGGDEFAVVLVPSDEAQASAAGLRVRATIQRPLTVEGVTVRLDASIGIALFPAHAADPSGLLQRADVAMYRAKRLRLGQEVYVQAADRHSRRRLTLIGELGAAIESGQLLLEHQPKADLATRAILGVEALVRWAHPREGLLLPRQFLPLAQQSGLSRTLTAAVLDRALAEIGPPLARGVELAVAVNLSSADLLDLDLPSEVDRLMARRDFPPTRLILEVSEDLVMIDPARTVDVLTRLRGVGVGIALDDFGTGHSSLSHLKELPVDELKIDRSFVAGMSTNPRDAAIVSATVELGRRLGLRVVGEGVATPRTWELLRECGCHEAQGHLIAPPMPLEQLRAWLARHPSGAAPAVSETALPGT